MAAKKDPRGRVDRIAGWIAEPQTSSELLERVRSELGVSRAGARRALKRVRKALRHRGLSVADETLDQVERLRLASREAREAGDFSARAAFERLIADIVGTKASEKMEVTLTPSQQALVDLAARARLSRDDE